MVSYLNGADVVDAYADVAAPRHNAVTGYGPKIPTRYRLKLQDGRTRRVYMMCYGNSGTPYVIVNGQDKVLDTDTEHLLPSIR